MLVIPSLRHCSNKYKLARKEIHFFLGESQVVSKEMSFQLLLEG